ncbi:MAG: hypothetical protein IKD01_05930 [Oscillospiraceae bacterium]|nr:hypothetical protein [Oscillospiraceae bacterium]
MKGLEFFLGANSGEGFYSLYEQLFTEELSDLLILKGSPGCGKSTLMKRLGAAAEAAGVEVHYVRCSGDPDSLDAVLLPALRSAVVDGTAPHTLEPRFAVARERYCDLSAGIDVAGVKARREEIVAASNEYRGHYARAYQILRAMHALESERRGAVHENFAPEKLHRRIRGIAAKELRGRGVGRSASVFLGGLTHKGRVSCLDSALRLCPRCYFFSDAYGLAGECLRELLAAAKNSGLDALAGLDPDRPQELRQVLLPQLGIAFCLGDEHTPCPVKPYRHIRVDAMVAEQLGRAEKAQLRFSRRILASLEEDATTQLRRAKAAHDALERLYRPHMDFSFVDEVAAREIRRLLG